MNSSPDKKGFEVFDEGLEGINDSRLTREAALGSRKDSGVRHFRGLGAGRPSTRAESSKGSGLLSPRPFTFT